MNDLERPALGMSAAAIDAEVSPGAVFAAQRPHPAASSLER
jgi:hypothetical protein